MASEYFDPPLFIKEGGKQDVHLGETPFFYNDGGKPVYVKTLPSGCVPLEPACGDALAPKGKEYLVFSESPERPDPEHGQQTKLKFEVAAVEYAALWVDRDCAAAFGITLVEEGQGIEVRSSAPLLQQVGYEYGMFAGHRSPYHGTGNRLLGLVCTDLERHNFPHVFASVDPELPLVISVGRYCPSMNKIYLADLWVPRGKALYIPASAEKRGHESIYLHGNRNSALACWCDGIGQSSVQTQTLLQEDGGFFDWYWNDLPTIHSHTPHKG